jgi:hypothetical protein
MYNYLFIYLWWELEQMAYDLIEYWIETVLSYSMYISYD